MWAFFRHIIDFILPPRCIKCGEVVYGGEGLCAKCFNEVNFISQPYCRKCGRPFENAPDEKQCLCGKCLKNNKSPFRLMRSAVRYEGISQKLIIDFKFLDRTDNAKPLAHWLNAAGKDIWQAGADMIIPVPLHYKRLLKRKYNQCGLLAAELHKLNGIPVDYTALVKHKATRPQVEFSGQERRKNIKGVFTVKHPQRIKGKRIVLIDDVMTTGSTVKECALALKKAGAKSVDVLTVARVC